MFAIGAMEDEDEDASLDEVGGLGTFKGLEEFRVFANPCSTLFLFFEIGGVAPGLTSELQLDS